MSSCKIKEKYESDYFKGSLTGDIFHAEIHHWIKDNVHIISLLNQT